MEYVARAPGRLLVQRTGVPACLGRGGLPADFRNSTIGFRLALPRTSPNPVPFVLLPFTSESSDAPVQLFVYGSQGGA